MSHISNLPLANQINLAFLEAESQESQLIRRVRESVGVEIQEERIVLLRREIELKPETDYESLRTILETSDDEDMLDKTLVQLALKAFDGDLEALEMLVEYYVEGEQRDFPKAMCFFKIAMQYHTWDCKKYPLLDSIIITVAESMFKNARTSEEKDYLHEVEAILTDYANKGFSDVKFHLALLYFMGESVPQNLDRVFQYFQEIWASDVGDHDEARDEKNEIEFFLDLLLTKVLDLAKRGNEKAKRVIAQIEEHETRSNRLTFYQGFKEKFDDSRFSNLETLDQNPDYLDLIGDHKALKKLARDGNPRACRYVADTCFEDDAEDMRRAYLCTAIDGGELEALVRLFYDLDSLEDQMLSKFQNWLGDDFTESRFDMLKDVCVGDWTPEFAADEAYNQHYKAKAIYQKEVLDEQDQKRADQLERDAYLFARVAENHVRFPAAARFVLLCIHAEGRVIERDLEKAFKLYFEAMPVKTSEEVYDLAPYFLRSDQNSVFDEAARLLAIAKLESLVETCKPGEKGVHFMLGCIALQDEKNFEKALGYFKFAASDYLFSSCIQRLLILGGAYEKAAFHLIEDSVSKAKAGDIEALKAFMQLAHLYMEGDTLFSSDFSKLVKEIALSSLASLEAGDPYALAQLHLIKKPSLISIMKLGIEREDLKKIIGASLNVDVAAMRGDRKAFIQYYHYYMQRKLDEPDVNMKLIIESISLPNRRLANEGDRAALSNFLALLDDCPGLEQDPFYEESLKIIVANLTYYLVPRIQNGQRDFADLLKIIQLLDERGLSYELLQDIAWGLAEENQHFCLSFGLFYARASKSQNIERAKICLERSLVLTNYQVEDREGLVKLYLESPVEMRGNYALCFLASYYLDLGDMDQVTIYLIQAVQAGAITAVLPLVDYFTDETHQDIEKAKAFMKVILEEFDNEPAIDGAIILDEIHAVPSVFKLLNQIVDEGDRDALYFSGTYEDYLIPAIRIERLKQAALKGHKFALGELMSFSSNARHFHRELAIAEVLFHQNPDNPEVLTYLKNGVLAFDRQAIDLFLTLKKSGMRSHPVNYLLSGVLMIHGLYVPHDMFGINLLRYASENGEHSASLILAEAYGLGFFDFDGVKIDILEDRPAALTYLNTIIGNVRLSLEMRAEAHSIRGMIAYTEEPETRDFQVAFQDFRIATHLGSAKGEYLLGLCYLRGDGVPTDPAQGYIHTANAARKGSKLGLEWLIGIAENDNNPGAQFDLGRIFTTLEDYDAALHFYQMAGDQGFPRAYVMMAQIYETLGEMHEVMPLYERAADEHYLPAMQHVADYYFEGSAFEEPNYHKAYLQYRFLSLNPELSLEYSYRLGSILFHGLGHVLNGVPRYADALPAYERAADRGHASAQFMLGRMYNEALGVERDLEKALTYLRSAAEQGHAEARILLNLLTQLAPPA